MLNIFSPNSIHALSFRLAGQTIFEGETSRGREDPDFPSLIAQGNVYWSANVLNPADELQAQIKRSAYYQTMWLVSLQTLTGWFM